MPSSPPAAPSRDLFIHRGTVLADGLATHDVFVSQGRIAGIDAPPSADALTLDARGHFVLPGIVDIHGDAFERHLMPRAGVAFDPGVALLDADRAIVANGITTAFHGVTTSWEPGLRSRQMVRTLLSALDGVADQLGADTRIHLRHETANVEGEQDTVLWLRGGRIGVLSFNDHLERIRQLRDRPAKAHRDVSRSGLDHDAYFAAADEVARRVNRSPASVERIAAAARQAGIPMMSHDDDTPALRRRYRDIGATIAEFPMNEATIDDAMTHGDAIVLGAPNVVRGGSHTGAISAAAMVRAGRCSILASDYYYPSLLLAPFALARQGDATFGEAWKLVSEHPARATGLRDRGSIRDGLRADLIVVAPDPQPRVIAAIVRGRIAYLADGALLR